MSKKRKCTNGDTKSELQLYKELCYGMLGQLIESYIELLETRVELYECSGYRGEECSRDVRDTQFEISMLEKLRDVESHGVVYTPYGMTSPIVMVSRSVPAGKPYDHQRVTAELTAGTFTTSIPAIMDDECSDDEYDE